MDQAIKPTATNGCYGWLIWLNAAKPCIGPRITERPVTNERDFPDLPADIYRFSGLFGQLVTVFPSQDLVIVRTGQDRGLVFSGGESWEHGLYSRMLGSITDQKIKAPGPAPKVGPIDEQNADAGFQNALTDPAEYSKGVDQDPLPPAGPARARALRPRLASSAGEPPRRGVDPARLPHPLARQARPGLQGDRAHAGRAAQQALRHPRGLHPHGEAPPHRPPAAQAQAHQEDDAAPGLRAEPRRRARHPRAHPGGDQAAVARKASDFRARAGCPQI